MVDVKESVRTTVSKFQEVAAGRIWKRVIIGIVAVLVLLFVGFIIKSLLYIAIFLIIVAVAVTIGVSVRQSQSRKQLQKN